MKWTRTPMRLRLFYRILFLLLVVSLVPMAGTGYLLHARIDRDLKEMAEHDMGVRADRAAAEITGLVDQHVGIVKSVALVPGITALPRAQQEQMLAGIQAANPDLSLIVTIGPNGQDLGRSDRGPSRPYGDLPHVKEALKGVPYGYQIAISRTTGKPTLEMAVPIMQGKTVQGVVLGALDLEKVGQFLKRVQVGETGYAWLSGTDDKIIVHPEMDKVKLRASVADHQGVAHARSGDLGTMSFAEGGKEWMGIARALPQGWVLVVQMERVEVMATLDAFNRLFGALMLGALAMVGILALVVTRNLTKPIQIMANFAGQVADGDLTGNLTLRRGDELGDMADSLRHMRDKMRMHVLAVHTSANRVAITTGDLGAAVAVASHSGQVVTGAFERTRDEVEEVTGQQRERLDQTRAVVVELANAVEQIAVSAGEQAAEVSKAAGIVAEVAQQAEVVVTGISRVAGATRQVESAAMAAREKVSGALSGIATTQASVDLGAETIRQMGVRAHALVRLLHEIGGLVTQTHLLASGAAGGPAAAGVADEVRRLAERSSALARESTDLLTAMQDGIQLAINCMTEGETAVRKGADQVKAAEWALAEIQQAAGTTMQEAGTMRTAVDILRVGQGQLSRAMEMLAAVAEENSAAAEEMAAGAETARSTVQELDTLAIQNFASINSVVPEMLSINRAIERVVQTITRLELIKTELSESTAMLRA